MSDTLPFSTALSITKSIPASSSAVIVTFPATMDAGGGDAQQRKHPRRFSDSVVHTVLSVNELLTPATSLEDCGIVIVMFNHPCPIRVHFFMIFHTVLSVNELLTVTPATSLEDCGNVIVMFNHPCPIRVHFFIIFNHPMF